MFSLWDYTESTMVKGTVKKPFLLNSDPELYHNLGMFLAHKKKLSKVINTKNDKIAIGKRTINNVGYPVFLGGLYRFIPDLSIGILFNLFSSLLVIILIGGIAYQIIPEDRF
ncbi:MAG TPA: hypothetical protein ENK91_00180, partial [Bacteroidetes bacterium]|nr:hypothetical protein [Bacteroidota bacterium]